MLSEPQSVVNFPKKYCNQFGMLYSCQPQLTHRNIVYGQALLPWYVGLTRPQEFTYDYFINNPFPKKAKLISVITSNKAFTRGHQERIAFVEKLKQHFGDAIDVYGRGFNDFADKWDVLKDYKYHIAIENCSTNYYWTEKLSDCYLAGCYPIYYGCKNIHDYFSEKSLSVIDIKKPDEAIKKIESILSNNVYENSIPALNESKLLVLNKYNMFNVIANCCDKLDLNATKEKVTLYPAKTGFDLHNMYKYTIERNILKLKQLLTKSGKSITTI